MNSLRVLNLSKYFKQLNVRSFTLSAQQMNKKVAVVLSGCGVYDGTEVTEASSVMIHLSRNNAEVQFYAPDIEQLHTINHLNGEVQTETRNVLVESARIARGNVKPLDQLKSEASKFDALVIPGGFGAAKNLCNWATQGTKCTVNKDLEKVMNEFRAGSKPIGLCCIAPVIAAKVLPECEITVGKKGTEWPYGGTIDSLKELYGVSVTEKEIDEINVDQKNKLVTTPAFMKNASFFEVYTGVGKMVDEVLKLA